jgi:hypothetical protein
MMYYTLFLLSNGILFVLKQGDDVKLHFKQRTVASSLSLTHAHARTCTRTHTRTHARAGARARTHARTHTHTGRGGPGYPVELNVLTAVRTNYRKRRGTRKHSG